MTDQYIHPEDINYPPRCTPAVDSIAPGVYVGVMDIDSQGSYVTYDHYERVVKYLQDALRRVHTALEAAISDVSKLTDDS